MTDNRSTAHSNIPANLKRVVEAWLLADPDPQTRKQLASLLEQGDLAALESCFSAPLTFGTAGLRGQLGPGPARMNRLVVRQAAAGLADYLGSGSTVVIGFDARHNSLEFAQDSARVLACAGVKALLLARPLPTPVLAFAIQWLGCDGGVMVTASHNPRNDNGYKVYLGDGAQITPPHDQAIEAAIRGRSIDNIPLAEATDSNIVYLGDEVVEAYLAAVVGPLGSTETFANTNLKNENVGGRAPEIVYTPMHGVGGEVLLAAFNRAGLATPSLVTTQFEPDGDFPTLPFPNPEEPGALDEAITTAEQLGAQLILANDPDADRLGVAIKYEGRWRILTGNEIGALLGDYVLRNTSGDDRFVATTIVSSRLLEKMAADHGVHYRDTLTGFKWIVRPAIDQPELRFVFGYEEALGFLVTDQVRDKDGISAAVMFAQLYNDLLASGLSVMSRLSDIYQRYGLHTTQTWQLRFHDVANIAKLMTEARALPPTTLGGLTVTETTDYLSTECERVGLGTNAVGWQLGDRGRVLLRPSGTEPKAKFYLEVFTSIGSAEEVAQAEVVSEELISAIREDLTSRFSLPVSEGFEGEK